MNLFYWIKGLNEFLPLAELCIILGVLLFFRVLSALSGGIPEDER